MKKLWLGAPAALLLAGGIAAAADFNGDGTEDIAVFRPQQSLWAVRNLTRVYFGSSNDAPMAMDYDGDRTDEIAVFSPATNLWAVRDLTRAYFGSAADRLIGGGAGQASYFQPGDIAIVETGLFVPDPVNGTSYEKVTEAVLGQGGAVRVAFSLSVSEGSGCTVFGRVYRNGTAVGTEFSTTTDAEETFTEDIGGWSPGDFCQLYLRTGGCSPEGLAGCNDFRISVGPGPHAGLTFIKGWME